MIFKISAIRLIHFADSEVFLTNLRAKNIVSYNHRYKPFIHGIKIKLFFQQLTTPTRRRFVRETQLCDLDLRDTSDLHRSRVRVIIHYWSIIDQAMLRTDATPATASPEVGSLQ